MKQEYVLETVLRRKRQWRRKIEKMPTESLIRTVYMEEMPGKDRERYNEKMGR